MHLAARARRPRDLRCLGALLRGGGDPNARSAEGLTPLHVAAAWGCRRGLQLLLSQGADPALRDQDGLRALDLAVDQGHQDCASLLRVLETWTPTPAETQEPRPKSKPGAPAPGPAPRRKQLDMGLSGPPQVTLHSTVLQAPLDQGDGRARGLEAGLEVPSLPAPQELATEDGSSQCPPELWDSSSDAPFLTAIEVSGAEDPAPNTSRSAETTQGFPPGVCPTQGSPGTSQVVHRAGILGREAELNARLQALTLASPDAHGSEPSLLLDRCPAHSPPRELVPGPPDFLFLTDDETSIDSDVAALWLTKDEGRDPVPPRWHPPDPPRSNLELPQCLRTLGERSGLVVPLTRWDHLQWLEEAGTAPGPDFSGHSPELAEALRTGRIPDAQADEDTLARQFEWPDPTRRWREGVVKSSFTYLLLDPRKTQDLPSRALTLTPAERLQTFVRSIFYVGKGTRARPDAHLSEALGHCGQPGKQACPKLSRILDIWASGHGVVSLHCFQHVVAVEAYTREACLVDALGIQMLTNQRQGHCYGVVGGWPPTRRRRLGVHLLHRALLVFLAEGKRELRPQDIQARS
ncbi:ankyrin repeat and LEM domain-containing protein 1 [Choloepus didactylus]|uniref:ankyrin repeat and LEM domain-containing protein 1 n=1 Tax=Choloepus didactylus TaxID=27675 RepID=UPI00189FC13B|nr:ankyrin repeat and LEM domain-containing protein 1 [Choloepus didactylus]